MKKIILLSIILLPVIGCTANFKDNAFSKAKSDLTNAVSGKVSETVQEGVATGLESAKKELATELTAKEIKISADNIDPKTINALLNDEVKLEITSSDNQTHGFYLPGYEITESVKSGETEVVTFKATKTGTFEYSCNINCQTGIKGSLIVK